MELRKGKKMIALGLVALFITMTMEGKTVSEASSSGSAKVGEKNYIVTFSSTISKTKAAGYTASDSSVTTKVTSWYIKKNKNTGKVADPTKKTKSGNGLVNVAFLPASTYISCTIVSEHIAKYGGDKITRTTQNAYN